MKLVHFFIGRPSICFDTNNVDWAPSLHLPKNLSASIPGREISSNASEQHHDECMYYFAIKLITFHPLIISTQVGPSDMDEADFNGSPSRDVTENYRAETLIEPLGQDDVTTLKEKLKIMEENLTAAHQKLNLSESTNLKLQQQLQEADSSKAILQEHLDDQILDSNITESFRKNNRTGSFYTGMI